MRETSLESINSDLEYIKYKRDLELEIFNDRVKSSDTEERIKNSFNSLMRIQNFLKLMEDVLVVYNIVKPSEIPKLKCRGGANTFAAVKICKYFTLGKI